LMLEIFFDQKLQITYPWVKKALDPGSGSATLLELKGDFYRNKEVAREESSMVWYACGFVPRSSQ